MKKIVDYFKTHFLFRDTVMMVIIFYLLRILVKRFGIYQMDLVSLIYDNAQQLYPIFLNSCITLLGFLLTGVSIIMIFLQDDKLEPLKEGDHFNSILKIYFSAIRICCLFLLISFGGLIILNNDKLAYVTGIVLFILAARLARCIWIIEAITTILYKKK